MKWFQTTGIYSLPEMIPKIILIFFIFSFIGWLCEVIYVGFIFEHKFINRGFLFGPICPIYGIAGVLMLFFPEKLQHSVILLFFSGVVICTAVEYISSFLLEKLFHTTWWDYSNKQIQIGSTIIKLNLNGRICLQNSLLFGIMTVIGIKFVFPFIQKIISSIPENFTKYFAIILSIIFIFDLIFSVKSLIDFNKYIYKIKTLGTTLEEKFHK
ncbi:MAG: putative ABC transporter permease, partial [Treponema sp.]|nr:putative ABC transporter permease [Treponema sp.]